jgi:tetratricopeptide (TPR) repeat protein
MRAPTELTEDPTQQLAEEWADGNATLKDVRGYSAEELQAIARTAHVFFCQGRIEEARVLFEGLQAIDPLDPYFASALAVVQFAGGNAQAALAAWDAAIPLAPDEPSVWVGRAEVKLALGNRAQAIADLQRALTIASRQHPLRPKIDALLRASMR